MLDSAFKNDPTSAAIAGGIIGGVIVAIVIFAIIVYVLTVIAGWKIFEKAGEKGWKSLIPIYNYYLLYKIVGMKNWFWALLVFGIIVSIVYSVYGVDTSNPEFYKNFDFGKLPIAVIISLCLESIVTIVVQAFYSAKTARVFGKGAGFAVMLFFFPTICWLILGFGSAKYNKKIAAESI